MCLICAGIKETIDDIVCYKVYVSFEGKLVSPYMRSPIPNMNEVAKTYLEEPHGKGNCIERGFHSFATLEDAINESECLARNGEYNPIIVRCIIPKDSKCYIGSFWGRTSYCSDSIKLIEICA